MTEADVNEYSVKYKKQAEELCKTSSNEKGKRGGRSRNGRWSIMNEVFDKHGLETDSAKLFDLVNRESTKHGLDPLEKGSFYSMLSIARKSARMSDSR